MVLLGLISFPIFPNFPNFPNFQEISPARILILRNLVSVLKCLAQSCIVSSQPKKEVAQTLTAQGLFQEHYLTCIDTSIFGEKDTNRFYQISYKKKFIGKILLTLKIII